MPAPPSAAAGLAFVLTLTGAGALTSDRFVLRAPGMPGSFTLVLSDPDLYGSTFASPVRIQNDTEGDLLALSVSASKVTESRGDGTATREHAGGEGQPPSWDRVAAGSESSAQLLRAGPVNLGEETRLVMILGRVQGVASLGAFELELAPSPAELLETSDGALFVRDASGTVVRTDAKGARPVPQKRMPEQKEKPSAACAALGKPPCLESRDGALVSATGRDVTLRDPDGRSRSFPAGGEGEIAALALGAEGRLYVATAGAGERRGSIRVFRPF